MPRRNRRDRPRDRVEATAPDAPDLTTEEMARDLVRRRLAPSIILDRFKTPPDHRWKEPHR